MGANKQEEVQNADNDKVNLQSPVRAFSFSTLYGPFQCEGEECNNLTQTVYLNEKENESLVESNGPYAANQILQEKLGMALCGSCRP